MKAPNSQIKWQKEREAFLKSIAPDSHFYRVFDDLPDTYFFVKNKLGQTLFCSSNLPHNHGFRDETEMLGKTDADLTPGALSEKYLADDAKIYDSGEALPPQIEVCVDHVGLPNWYRTCKYPVKDRSGNVIGIMGTFQLASIDGASRIREGGLETACQLLACHLERFPGIALLAKCCKMSVRNFQRSFSCTFRCSAQTYWMKLRIRSACQQIRSQEFSIAEISSDLGFYDQSSFTKHFKKHTGKTPKDYSKANHSRRVSANNIVSRDSE
jgi:AraC-like DNA-binding protein